MRYREEMKYRLELARGLGAASIVDDVLSILYDLAETVASKTITAAEREEKAATLRSLALEMQDSPEMLNKFKWASFAYTDRYRNDVEIQRQVLEARDAIVRVACPFLERYLYITFSELKAYVDAYRAQKEDGSPPGRSLTQMPG